MLAASLLVLAQSATVVPADRMGEQWWKDRHANAVAATKAGGFNVAFLGDSITQGWEGEGKAAWGRDIAPLKAANFGFGGDRTQHVLWRLDNGEIIAANPKVVVIMIGTNNSGSNTAAEIAEGVNAIVAKLLHTTTAKILLLGIFPRSETANDGLRVKVAEATKIFSSTSNPRVTNLDIGKFFIRSDGTLRGYLMPDRLHLSPDGYGIWSKAMMPTLKSLL